jgi:multiple sugar transport system substrate-binding protein
MFDTKTQKWVVDSPGLRATFGFYKSVYASRLGAPQGKLFSPNSVVQPPDMFRKSQLAICVGCANWYPGAWTATLNVVPWPKAPSTIGVTALPTNTGQPPRAGTTLAGWDTGISRTTKSPDLAWKLVAMLEEPQNSLDLNNWSGMVPPSRKVASSPGFTHFAPPQGAFNAFVKFGQILPTDLNFPVYLRAINYATGTISQNPSVSLDSVIETLTEQLASHIGSDKVEVLP